MDLDLEACVLEACTEAYRNNLCMLISNYTLVGKHVYANSIFVAPARVIGHVSHKFTRGRKKTMQLDKGHDDDSDGAQ